MEIKVTTTMTKREYLSMLKRKIPTMIIMSVLFGMCISYLVFERPSSLYSFNTTRFVVFSAMYTVIYFAAVFLLAYFQLSKEYSSSKAYQNPITLTFTHDGIARKNYNSEAFAAYDEIFKVRETDKIYIFFVSKRSGFFLAKKDIDTDIEEKIIEIITAKIPKKKLKIRKISGR